MVSSWPFDENPEYLGSRTLCLVKKVVLLGDPKIRKGLLFAKRSFILRKGLLLWLKLFIRIMFDI